MRLGSLLRSRWLKVPLLLLALVLLVAVSYLAYRLATTTPSMYNAAGSLAGGSGAVLDPNSETLVYTSLRPGCGKRPDRNHSSIQQPYGELYVIAVDGSSPAIRLTEDKWEDSLPFWGAPPLVPTDKQVASAPANK